jgi:hypothetical protein
MMRDGLRVLAVCIATFIAYHASGQQRVAQNATPAVARAKPSSTERSGATGGAASVALAQQNVAASASPTIGPRVKAPSATGSVAASESVARYRLEPTAIEQGRLRAVSNNKAEVVTEANLSDKIAAGALFVSRTSPTKETAPLLMQRPPAANLGTSGLRLGFQMTARKAGGGAPVRFAAHIADGTGLTFDAQTGYAGTFYVALSNLDEAADQDRLERPVELMVRAQGASVITPTPLQLDALSRWFPVFIQVPDVSGSSYPVAVSADPLDRGDDVDLPIVRPVLHVSAANSEIIGWGIGTTEIRISASHMKSPANYQVVLTNDNGGIEPTMVTLDAKGNAMATLRSSSAASTRVGIDNKGVVSDVAQVNFGAPWGFLFLAIAGGLLGALIRKEAREQSGTALVIGAASAVVMTLAYAVGIDWLSKIASAPRLAQSGEAVVFVMGAIGALAGATALVRSMEKEK